jgi:ADP-ribose pyrophosphatase YjhB (NUDIX family)
MSQIGSEPEFVAEPGQVDFTNIRYAPVLDVVVVRENKVLLAKRSANRNLYPNYWSTIAGFLDDDKSIEDKAYEELREELGMQESDVVSLKRGSVILREDPKYHKTWFIMTMLAHVKTDAFTLDWEASEARWFELPEIAKLDLLPGTLEVIRQFL